ncbi:MBL fold metallo-hydrolase [Demetria terragena]|uniref:MBL fold metallo-hydrolase n=1 Tax=Demetria terragena TaxID=63959 RepID=UPI0003643277|nr:MBL fold metallo-hydrolase [Demetria terragena]
MSISWTAYGPHVSVLDSPERGGYPYANSLLVRGSAESVLIDPSRGLLDAPPATDLTLVSHGHEDHMVALDRYASPVHCHRQDLPIVHDPSLLAQATGAPPETLDDITAMVVDEFEVSGRPDAVAFESGSTFDLGGCQITVVFLPGHTRGHCGFLIEPDGFFFTGDIDLTGFGPFYGGLDSNLEDFEASLHACREVDARWYGTAHQKGVIEGATDFRERLDAYAGAISRREAQLMDFLTEPRTLEEIVAHRIVYRPHVTGPHVDPVERRTAALHLERLLASGAVSVNDERYLAR